MNTKNLPRGVRNNNPLNIRLSKTRWKGQVNGSPLPKQGERGEGLDKEFVTFESMEYGFRAAFCLLRTYARKYRLTCINDIIRRWAPPNENDTQRYIRNVCLWTGFGGNQRLTEAEWPALVKAMARQEGSICERSLTAIDWDACIRRGFELYCGRVGG